MSNRTWAAPLEEFTEDKLNLGSFADDLTNIVMSGLPHPTNESSKVIALNSGWGTGKTSFINMWTNQLDTDKFTYLIYNAWENDDYPNALIPILCSFQQNFDGSTSKGKKLIQDIVAIALAFGPKFLGQMTQVLYGVNLGVFVEAYKEYRKKKLPDMDFEKFSVRQKQKELFRKLIDDIRGKHDDIRGKDGYLLILIDELDRCRPTFAIETLEVVKHFFDIPQVVFVFSLDMNQLQKSIKTIYGDIDSMGYLQRFFDHIIPLPKPSTLENFLEDRLEILEDKYSGFEIELLAKLAKKFSISLRALNVICVVYNRFKTYILSQKTYSWFHQEGYDVTFFEIYLAFIVLACSYPEKYQSLLRNGTSEQLGKEIFGLIRVNCYTSVSANSTMHDVFEDDKSDLKKCFCAVYESQLDPSLRLWQYIDINIQNSWIKAKETETILPR